jgi:2-methylisocitrate lyase-like PEP mutase family enzyme
MKAEAFRALHARGGAFVIANAWDGASARLLAAQGFAALATSSGASAAALGRVDGRISRDEALDAAALIVGSTELPVSADLEKGFGDDPRTVAETIRRAMAIGLAGGSIEDFTGDAADPLFDEGLAVERIAAAAEAARTAPDGFVLTARCENFLRGRPDLDATVRRLQAYERAGADVLFAPGLPDLAAIRTVCREVTRPVNFMAGLPGKSFTVAELTDAGVTRISLAGSLYRAAMTAVLAAAREVSERGTFTYIDASISTRELNALLR